MESQVPVIHSNSNSFSIVDIDSNRVDSINICDFEAVPEIHICSDEADIRIESSDVTYVDFQAVLEDSIENFGSNFSSDYKLRSIEIKNPEGKSFFTPVVDKGFEPREKMVFDEIEDGFKMYKTYSRRAGFDCKKGSNKKSDGVCLYKYMFCTRGGKFSKKDLDTLKNDKNTKKRKRSSKKTDCEARILFKYIKETGKYMVLKFIKVHNHVLFTDDTIHMSKQERELDEFDKRLIYTLSSTNIGPTKAHAVMTVLKGGFDLSGPKCVDYKNWARDLNCYIGESDANMFVKLMSDRQDDVEGFSFEYACHDNHLVCCFWADSVAKRNYLEFSDVISFDATFSTNKYNMIFVPFTGIDNHKKSVTFGAGLLGNETAESYTWLLQSFLKLFGKQPRIVVTDQDPAIAKAVSSVFNQSKHRLCMWHIGKKLTDKVCPKIIAGTDFRERLQNIIWDPCIDSDVFERNWLSLIREFKLEDNKWLKDMYDIRDRWIPAFFKDIKLSGLMRTTSLSESQNFFFQNFMKKRSNLLEFMLKFDSSMDKQRNKQATNDYDSLVAKHSSVSPMLFEIQASDHYTLKLFRIFQDEIFDSAWTCQPSPEAVSIVNDNQICTVFEQPYHKEVKGHSIYKPRPREDEDGTFIKQYEYQVEMNEENEFYKCSCMLFEHHGFLCRHILCVLRTRFIRKIPSSFLLRRWQKDIIEAGELKRNYSVGCNVNGCQKKVQEMYSLMAECIRFTSHDPEATDELLESFRTLKKRILSLPIKKDSLSKGEHFDSFVGVSKPSSIQIKNPEIVKTKGSGSGGKRLKSQREIALEVAAHLNWKRCNFCDKLVDPADKHDKRNCPLKIEMQKKKKEKEEKENQRREREASKNQKRGKEAGKKK